MPITIKSAERVAARVRQTITRYELHIEKLKAELQLATLRESIGVEVELQVAALVLNEYKKVVQDLESGDVDPLAGLTK